MEAGSAKNLDTRGSSGKSEIRLRVDSLKFLCIYLLLLVKIIQTDIYYMRLNKISYLAITLVARIHIESPSTVYALSHNTQENSST